MQFPNPLLEMKIEKRIERSMKYIRPDSTLTNKDDFVNTLKDLLLQSSSIQEYEAKITPYIKSPDIFAQRIFETYTNQSFITENKLDIFSYAPKLKYFSNNHSYIVYVAGLEPFQNEPMEIYKEFINFGEIVAITTDIENNYALVQFKTAESCFSAVTSQKKFFYNDFIKVGYATNLEDYMEDQTHEHSEDLHKRAQSIHDFAAKLRKERNIKN
ncbi:hypothetical protein TVAG_492730 [Trichomonas vaginalis G3]|uniref:RRM domain-containing protein n=1 Tax=Trichomonas vaginalis (strain ATCC PRA-98 / G3) TaxID=412133 RepID=A2F8I9_TRIV3|nr:RNA-binding domain, RBD family-containing protein [Trichomonas vaginalis G3]EAX98782.1 hypothetical protein TVAG_492730 [Trichomonas vaginalis G3]KAI5483861.1 RNA-binding domain, RBD family-containing protein [Trichomonas vaginalis G3]|eukprot:XP_001311712.1 hypothetical protein [Trichomonas vaginalis G3]